MVEHSQDIDEFGTPRAFEIIPYWTSLDTLEGTLMEASFTAAFHFINQAELSVEPSNAIIGVNYPSLDVTNGLTHLQLMNIPYFITVTQEVTDAVMADGRGELLKVVTTDRATYSIFRIADASGYVEVMKNEPVRLSIPQNEWRDMANSWYLTPEALETPIVWDQGEEALQGYPSISSAEEAVDPPQVPTEGGEVTNVVLENESLSFDTTAVGQPHWIKVSYFPNWQVEGAEGPYLASPSFMMVIPTSEHVVLSYGRTAANNVGQALECLGWALLIGLSVWRGILWWRRRRLAGEGVDK